MRKLKNFLNLVSARSPSYLKQKTFQYCLWGIHYIFSFSFWHGDRVWTNFSIVIREKMSVKCSLGLRELRFPSPKWVQGRIMLGDQESLILTAQKVIDWVIIYSFFTSNLVLLEWFLYKFGLVKWLRFVIFQSIEKYSFWKLQIWQVNHKSQVVNSNPWWLLLVWFK